MRKIPYLCVMMLLSMNMAAQIDPCDRNWDTLFLEDFSGVRSWDNHWDDTRNIQNYSPLWRCFTYSNWPSGVVIYNPSNNTYKGLQAYQPSHAEFGADQTMKLKCEFKSWESLFCSIGYSSAPWHKYCHYCEDSTSSHHPNVHYYSGMIETIDPVGFGYYEIECKMPVHDHGENSSFWFWSTLGGTYNEIDVFEHNEKLSGFNIEKGTTSGIWYNPHGTNYSTNGLSRAHRYSNFCYTLPANSPPLDEYHIFGCLWLPEKVTWYVDGTVVNEWGDPTLIPQYPMWLKITHYPDDLANSGTLISPNWWTGSDEMTINYVKALRLKADCDTDAVLRTITDFNNFEYSVKRSITMGGVDAPLVIPSNIVFTMRAVESISIDDAFELLRGTEMSLFVHECPQCSMEGVNLPSYNCGMEDTKEP